ncbi:hypothetical protein C8F04DRAFT_1202246 [Mycena alexandri]|uniref:Uncharacterized protein n=1 Tax=Mycena alexandri TaxID=1745969 RepID=A0AAD6RX22_9AGAR|nr:hypothetical protein C8F04DRAFT_1202246 [Mycena alexandri]
MDWNQHLLLPSLVFRSSNHATPPTCATTSLTTTPSQGGYYSAATRVRGGSLPLSSVLIHVFVPEPHPATLLITQGPLVHRRLCSRIYNANDLEQGLIRGDALLRVCPVSRYGPFPLKTGGYATANRTTRSLELRLFALYLLRLATTYGRCLSLKDQSTTDETNRLITAGCFQAIVLHFFRPCIT